MSQSKKRPSDKVNGRILCPTLKATDHKTISICAILDYVLAHAQGDKRPYLTVSVYGKPMLGLLDSGSTSTILGGQGWNVLKSVCRLDSTMRTSCVVANGNSLNSIGSVRLPVCVRDKCFIISVLVVPDLRHTLILGIDFWIKMGLIPDVGADEWSFRGPDDLPSQVSAVEAFEGLSNDQKSALDSVISEAFVRHGNNQLGCTSLVELHIRTDSPPIKQRYYPLSPALQKQVDVELDDMLSKGIIEPSNSPWSSPIVMIKKKSGDWRFCVDYRALNRVTVADAYPIPFVSATLDKLRDAKFLSTLDIRSAYWQIPVSEESRPLTAFTVPRRGLFQFKRMPFGLTNAPAVWQRLIDRVVGVDLEPYAFVYLDDVIICTPSFEEHLRVLKEVMNRLTAAGLSLNRDKCNFCKSELKYLGYVVNSSGLLVDPEKVEAIVRIPPPKTVTEVRRIVGLASWYRRFVPNFSTLMSPLTNLTRKNVKFRWDDECENAFHTVKDHLIRAPVLSCPDFEKPFTIQCDASDYGLGAVLTQTLDDKEHVICYLSRSLTKPERKYSTTEKECLAVLFAVEKLRPYIQGSKFYIITDHYCLKWLNSIKDPVGRIARWAIRLQQYDYEITHRKGKDHVVPDALSRTVPVVDAIDTEELPDFTVVTTTDKWYKNMYDRVRSYPSSFPLWTIDGEKLFKRARIPYPDLVSAPDEWLLVLPRDTRTLVIKHFHDSPMCGHPGVAKTFARVAERYYWPNMRVDVARYVGKCHVCLQAKPEQRPSMGKMCSVQPTCSRPWQVVSVDLVGPLPRSSSGYSFIFSVCDVFSKYVLFFPLRKATAPGIVKWLEDYVILVHGAPEKLIADNGSQFRSKQFRDLMKMYGVRLQYTANYHPQANPVERTHRVLKTMLSCYLSDNHTKWDTYLAKVGCAIRSARHDVTGLTPNFVVYGREIRFSLPLADHRLGDSENCVDPQQRAVALSNVFKDVQKRLIRTTDKAKSHYDLRKRDDRFQLHQQVYRRNFHLSDASKKFTSKLGMKYSGPYTVSKIVSPWTYEIADQAGRSLGVFHAKDLKAHPPDDNESED